MISIWNLNPVLIDGQYVFDEENLTPRQYQEVTGCPDDYLWVSEDKRLFKPISGYMDRYTIITELGHNSRDISIDLNSTANPSKLRHRMLTQHIHPESEDTTG